VHDHHHLTNLATQSANNYSFAVNKGFDHPPSIRQLARMIEALYPALALTHVFLDNARYRRARLVQDRLAQPGRRSFCS
jgi:adenosylmethionine-8-amino-7-oxononanoate aminotransferase